MSMILEATNAGGCGSVTVYAVDFDKEIAVEMIRFPWNETAIRGFKSEAAASAFIQTYINAEVGTVPDHFEVCGYEDAISGKGDPRFFELLKAIGR